MDVFISILLDYGTVGLAIAALTESFLSPIPPDVLLVTLAMAVPTKAIYYGLVATSASVVGGCLGYALGHKFGPSLIERFGFSCHMDKLNCLVEKYGAWAIFFGALAPIPYKFICISAGTLRIRPAVFLAASLFGRAKRFLLEGMVIYYYGPQALTFVQNFTPNTDSVLAVGIVLAVIIMVYWRIRARKVLPSPG